MSTTYLQILFILAGNVASCCVTMYIIRWKKRENKPRELEIELDQLRKDIVNLREQIKYIQGRMNGKGWLREI